MNSKQAKKIRRLAERMTMGKSKQETDKVYNRLKKIHKETKGK